jgi:hypothetical protein
MSEESIKLFEKSYAKISVLETIRQIKEKHPLAGAILDWVRYGDVRSQRIPKFLTVKEEWLGRIQNYLTRDEVAPDGGVVRFAPLWARIDEILNKEKKKKYDVDEREKLINGLWRDFVGFAEEGYTFGIPERLLNTLKLVEFRGLELEVKDLLDQWSDNKLFRVYLWTTKPFGLRVKFETATRRYLEKHPQVRSFLYKTFSPVLSKDLTNKLLDAGRLLPNRLVEAFLDRTFKQRFPEEILAGLKGTLSPKQFKLIKGSTLAELDALVEKKLFPAKAYNQLKYSLYVKWRRWFLPGRFMDWAGRNLTKIQDKVFQWLEEQIIKENLVGKVLDSPIIRAAGSRSFVDRALGRGRGFKKAPLVIGARKAAAGAALALRRRGARAAAKVVVKLAQGASKLTGPVGAVVSTVATFIGGKIVKKVLSGIWEKTKGVVTAILATAAAVVTIPVSLVLAVTGCSCAFLLAPFLLLVFIIAPAFQPGETGGWLGQEASLVRVEKTVTPNQVAVGPHPLVNYKLTVANLSATEAITAGTLIDEYDSANFTPSTLDGADNSQAGELVWTVDSIPPGGKIEKNYNGFINSDADKRVFNRVSFTATLGGETVSETTSAVVKVGAGGGECGALVAAAAEEIIHEWPVGKTWRGLKVCDPACTNRRCEITGTCYGTGLYSDYYPSLNCYHGMVCTDLVVAAYDVAGCPLPGSADTRWSPTMWATFNQSALNLARYANGGSMAPEVGDVLFYGRGSAIRHVSIITEVRDNGLIMHQANSRRCRFVPKTGTNLYEGYDYNHQVIGWGRML